MVSSDISLERDFGDKLDRYPVTGWDGGKNRLDQHLERDKRLSPDADEDDAYNQEYDRGRVSLPSR